MTPTEALQAWLALEHEAVWTYPVIGARLESLVDRAQASFDAHRDTRDALRARLRALGAEPVTAPLSYETGPLTTATEAKALAQRIESDICAATLTLSGVAEGDLRAYAVESLTVAALAEMTWGAEPRAFPGLP